MSVEESQIAEYIINSEKSALDKWFKGDTSGFLELWSKKNFSYFDGSFPTRVDDYATIKDFVLQNVEKKLFADKYEFKNPRVQFGKDMALLTYQLFAKTTLINMQYNCIELFQKEESGEWKVIHSTWSFIRPMDMDFGVTKSVV